MYCYLVLTVLTLTKQANDFRKISAKPWTENTANNVSTSKQQENGRADTSPTPRMSSFATVFTS